MSLYAGQDRDALRGAWRAAWQRHCNGLPLEPLQAQMVDVIALHPEYHEALNRTAEDSAGDGNAFLHLSLHLALREQLATRRPAGIVDVHRRLVVAGDAHEAEHRMIEVLAQTLWEAQQSRRMPDEQLYLEALRRL